MGCDIHIVLERVNKECDEWVGMRDYRGMSKKLTDLNPADSEYVSPYVWFKLRARDYSFFNALCGVRVHAERAPRRRELAGALRLVGRRPRSALAQLARHEGAEWPPGG